VPFGRVRAPFGGLCARCTHPCAVPPPGGGVTIITAAWNNANLEFSKKFRFYALQISKYCNFAAPPMLPGDQGTSDKNDTKTQDLLLLDTLLLLF
jgi:hypothetical protein